MKLVLSLLIFFFSKSIFAMTTLIIDPGHGGTEDGAVYNNKREADLCLTIAKVLKNHIEAASDWKVILTRETDQTLELSERTDISKKNQAHIFLSLHANASTAPSAKGVEFYLQNQLPMEQNSLFLASEELKSLQKINQKNSKNDVENIISDLKRTENLLRSYELSWHLLKNWSSSTLGTRHRKIHQAPLYVLTQNTIPAVLAEVGFISNKEESEKLSSSEHQKQMAIDLFNGLLKFKENIDKPTSKALN